MTSFDPGVRATDGRLVVFSVTNKYSGQVLGSPTRGGLQTERWANEDRHMWVVDPRADTYRLSNLRSGQALDGADQRAYAFDDNQGDFQVWKLRAEGDGWYAVQHVRTGAFLEAGVDGHVFLRAWYGADSQRWRFAPVPVNWHVDAGQVVYPEGTGTRLSNYVKPVDLASTNIFRNNANSTLTQKLTYTKSRSKTFSFGFKETLKVGLKTTLEAQIPFTVAAKSELSVELALEANQQWTSTEVETYTVEQQVQVPPMSAMKVHSYINWIDDFTVPFSVDVVTSAQCLVRAAQGAERFGQTPPTFSADDLEWLLLRDGFTGTVVDRSRPGTLTVRITGEFRGSWGLETNIDTVPLPLTTP